MCKKIALTLVGLYTCMCMYAYNLSYSKSFEIDGIYYSILSNEAKTVVVKSWDKSSNSDKSGEIIIPNSVIYDNNLYTVVGIGGFAFSSNHQMTSIVLPNGIKEIDDHAFSSCSNLTQILLPDSLERIGSGAFASCSKLVSITIPLKVNIIESEAFIGCTDLESVVILSEQIQMQKGVFEDCSNLISVRIPSSVKTIEDNLFKGCINLSSVRLNEIVENIGSSAFENCFSLKTISIPGSVKTIGKNVFKGCNNLSSIFLEDGVRIIGDEAFVNLTCLKEIIIPNSVTDIGNKAFEGCSCLSYIYIPYGVINIGEKCFDGCNSLSDIFIPSTVQYIGNGAFDGTVWLKEKKPGILYINDIAYVFKGDRLGINKIYIKDGTKYITGALFKDWEDLENVNIPNSIISIGEGAFDGCRNLKNIILPDGIETISDYAFQGCKQLKTLLIPNSVKYIGNNAFAECSNLESITFPNNATYIGEKAFDNTMWMAIQPDGIVYIGNVAYKYKGEIPRDCSIIIRNGTEVIASGAFNGYEVNSISLPDGLKTINDNAFDISWITTKKIELPKSVNYVGKKAFTAYDLKKVVVHFEQLDSIIVHDNAFNVSRWDKCKLVVPQKSKHDYQTKKPWNEFVIVTEGSQILSIMEIIILVCIPIALLFNTRFKRIIKKIKKSVY